MVSNDKQVRDLASQYCKFQEECPSPFHVVETLKVSLSQSGFKELDDSSDWSLQIGAGYFVCHRDGKSLLTFKVGETAPQNNGFHLACAHTDSPSLRLRLNPFATKENLLQVLTQYHGGLIARTWLDRPMNLAGAVYKLPRSGNSITIDQEALLPVPQRILVQSKKPLMVIPDIAIHLDREKNRSGKIDFETMLSAVAAVDGSLDEQKKRFWECLGQSSEGVDGFELSLAPYFPHVQVGVDGELITGPRHDDLAMVFAIYKGLTDAGSSIPASKTLLAGFFDAEETGSQTSSGAASSFLPHILRRICQSHPKYNPSEQIERAFSQSFLISADMAHAYHPAHPQKYDPHHKLLINKGIAIKDNANDRYATSGQSAAIFRGICEAAKVPVQNYVNRQDIGCGSTIGPILAAQLNCLAVDVGTPMWSMHSSAETMGALDLFYAKEVMQTFFAGSPT
ncbi:MAG: M18 family aminopeptidase [Oligoflexales bacterium]